MHFEMELDVDERAATDVNIVDKTSISAYFDDVIGHIQDIVLSEQFMSLQDAFLETHWQKFESGEENKLEYTDIYGEYTSSFESFLVSELSRRMDDFNMQRFADELEKNEAFRDTLNYCEIYELLHSFHNFEIFKELMLDYRSKKEGHTRHLDCDILITKALCATSKPKNFSAN